MGASFSYRIYPDMTREKLTKAFRIDVEQSRYESGHSYSGEIGMLGGIEKFMDIELDSRKEASDYVADNQEKWDPAIAVSFLEKKKGQRKKRKYWLIGGWCSS